MRSCEKGQFPYSFFILLTEWYAFPASILTNFHIFTIPLSLNVTLFLKSLYLAAHIKINYETGCFGRFSEKNTDVSRTIAAAKMEFLMSLVCSFPVAS